MIKSLHETNRLFLLPNDQTFNDSQEFLNQIFSHTGTPYRRSFRQIKQVARRYYCLNTNEALQIIWRAALIAKRMGITELELEGIRDNKYVGEINKL